MFVIQVWIEMYQVQICQVQVLLCSDEVEFGYICIYVLMFGMVVVVDVCEGQIFNVQQQILLILWIVKLLLMIVWVQVLEVDIGWVKFGMLVYFMIFSGEGWCWIGKVWQIFLVLFKLLDQSNQGGGSFISGSGGQSGSGWVVLYIVLVDVDNGDY